MITRISLLHAASFQGQTQELDGLATFNYIYGANGTGKTTISRLIADQGPFPFCSVDWTDGAPLDALVYNTDYVEANFNLSDGLKGVFTLGEDSVEAKRKIGEANAHLEKLKGEVAALRSTLSGPDGQGGKLAELTRIDSRFAETCWRQKQKHDGTLKTAFEGYRNSKEGFRDKLLAEEKSNSAEFAELEELQEKAESVFGPAPELEDAISVPSPDALLVHEGNTILKKLVTGREDVDIAAMINRLGNSDWVHEGVGFYESNDGFCPFCQQSTPESFRESLAAYFDATFARNQHAIADLAAMYRADSEEYRSSLLVIVDDPPEAFLDVDSLEAQVSLLDSRVAENTRRLQLKLKEPSSVVSLERMGQVVRRVQGLLDEANAKIKSHNDLVRNLRSVRTTLSGQVWRYLLDVELKAELVGYHTERRDVESAIDSLRKNIVLLELQIAGGVAGIRELERSVTSTRPTIDDINGILSSFGFSGFSLVEAQGGASYRIVRIDGSPAKASLSEGEKNFVAFLYFFHSIRGSVEASGQTSSRVVVFDDPVSSLDSEILFIVGSLIKNLVEDVRRGRGTVKQVFVLTHNVYFHKEVTFNPRRSAGQAMCEETFWIVRKTVGGSTIKRYLENPIKTSYELLWCEVRDSDRSRLTIQNTLRRILDHYFRILGNIDKDEICERFEGRERLICNSLFSWVNDGSHSAHDDLYVAIDDSVVDDYLDVFRRIFDVMDQAKHYEMMMNSPMPKVVAPSSG